MTEPNSASALPTSALENRAGSWPFAVALPDDVGPETVPGRGRDPVQVEDGNQGTQQRRRPVFPGLRVNAIEQLTAQVFDARGLLMVGAQLADSFRVTCWCFDVRAGAARMYSRLAKFKSVSEAGGGPLAG